jgi:NAD(P)-dependent dehydrogenase (short-subunit alcohol dehydrogenase family)
MPETPNAATGPLAGKRVLLVGASAGIGRALAVRLIREGAQVVLAARRESELGKTAAEAAGGHPVCVDIRDAKECQQLAVEVRTHLGQVDFLISCVGAAPLRMMAETSPAEWRHVLETNVVGFHQLLQSCLPVLAPHAFVAALSSESVDQPRIALGAYATSKVALERALQAWQTEHPELRLCRIRVGQTFPTDFGSGFDPDTLGRALEDWGTRGLGLERFMSPDQVAGTITGLLAVAAEYPAVCVDELTVRASASATTFDKALSQL